jgi:micrococcal nuclease
MINNLYTYLATVERVVDGDTAELTIDLGFKVMWKANCRFHGINTPELTSKDEIERAKAQESRVAVSQFLKPKDQVKVVSKKLDKYGRPVVDVYCGENFVVHLNQWLLDQGLAKPYMNDATT